MRRSAIALRGFLVFAWLAGGGCHGVSYHLDTLNQIREHDPGSSGPDYRKTIVKEVPVLGVLRVLPWFQDSFTYEETVDRPEVLVYETLADLQEVAWAGEPGAWRAIWLFGESVDREEAALSRATALRLLARVVGETVSLAEGGRVWEPSEPLERAEMDAALAELARFDESAATGLGEPGFVAAVERLARAELASASLRWSFRLTYRLVRLFELLRERHGPGHPVLLRALDEGLGRLAARALLQGVRLGLEDGEPIVRRSAATAALALPVAKVLSDLLDAFRNEKEPSVRREILYTVGGMQLQGEEGAAGWRALEVLSEAVRDPDETVSAAAKVALSRATGGEIHLDPVHWADWWEERVIRSERGRSPEPSDRGGLGER